MTITHHEALTDCLKILNGEYDQRDASIEEIADVIADLVLAFEPYAGDPTDAPKRVPHPCRCKNCHLTFVRFWLPADVGRVARAAQRGAICPRCYATEGIVIPWGEDRESNHPPMSFSANIVSYDQMKLSGKEGKITVTLEARGTSDDIMSAQEALSSGQLATITTMPGSLKI